MAEMNKKVEISNKTVMLQSMLTMLILVLMMFCEAFSVQASDQFSGEKSQTVVTADTKTMPILSVKSAFQNTARSKSTVTPTPKPKNRQRKEGHAYRYYVNNKPVINCDEILPGIRYKSGFNSPTTFKSKTFSRYK